jgi:AraC family transcriptional regulator of adaptative response / DNA-3-methyladenine glycosylase II
VLTDGTVARARAIRLTTRLAARSEKGQTRPGGGATSRAVDLNPDVCHRALSARDPRFDGLFFVGVATTDVYCRPICPARTPGRRQCRFFRTAAEAERAGFRACLRCRPELAPGTAEVDSLPRLVARAVAKIDEGYLNERSCDELADELGVTSRHLRRAMEARLGIAPVELAQTRRLALAKQLLHDSKLPLAEVAFAAGFSSVRRFNSLFRERFGRPPTSLRRESADGREPAAAEVRLDYRAPFEWEALLAFLGARAIPGVEQVVDGVYQRAVTAGEHRGWLAVRRHPSRPSVVVTCSASLAPKLMTVVARLRPLLDLDARPEEIARHLGSDPAIGAQVKRRPGLRVPGAFDPFEMTVRAILGQQVTVRGATTLAGRFAETFGAPLRGGPAGIGRTFPSAAEVARASVDEVRQLGVPGTRAQALREVAAAFASGALALGAGSDPEQARALLEELPGIGPWTAQYVLMRGLKWPDAFPASDLAVLKALQTTSAREAERRSQAWRPWRSYAVMHLWSR